MEAIGYLPLPGLGNYSKLTDWVTAKVYPPPPSIAYKQYGVGPYYDSLRLIEKYGSASFHPVGCPAGTAIIDNGTGDLKINGPFYPITKEYPGYPGLLYEPAPRIEIWIN